MQEELKLYKNTWTRKSFGVDRKMVNECLENYVHFTFDENSIVMDLGANIGGFTKMMIDQPIKEYIGVEPDPDNLELAKLNSQNAEFPITWYQGVATIRDTENLTFYTSGSGNSACSGTSTPANLSNFRKGTVSTVKNFNIESLLEKHKPTHLKIDIEGAELEWFTATNAKIPDYVQEVALEFHRKEGIVKFDQLWYNILKEDFDVTFEPLYGYTNVDNIESFPNLGIELKGRVFGIDVFLKRK